MQTLTLELPSDLSLHVTQEACFNGGLHFGVFQNRPILGNSAAEIGPPPGRQKCAFSC